MWRTGGDGPQLGRHSGSERRQLSVCWGSKRAGCRAWAAAKGDVRGQNRWAGFVGTTNLWAELMGFLLRSAKRRRRGKKLDRVSLPRICGPQGHVRRDLGVFVSNAEWSLYGAFRHPAFVSANTTRGFVNEGAAHITMDWLKVVLRAHVSRPAHIGPRPSCSALRKFVVLDLRCGVRK